MQVSASAALASPLNAATIPWEELLLIRSSSVEEECHAVLIPPETLKLHSPNCETLSRKGAALPGRRDRPRAWSDFADTGRAPGLYEFMGGLTWVPAFQICNRNPQSYPQAQS